MSTRTQRTSDVRSTRTSSAVPYISPSRPTRVRANGRIACDFCRKRKIRCDGDTPCAVCVRHKRHADCVVTERPRRNRPTLRQMDEAQRTIRSLASRLAGEDQAQSSLYDDEMQSHAELRFPSSSSQSGTPRSLYDVLPLGDQQDETRQEYYHGPTAASFHADEKDSDEGLETSETTRIQDKQVHDPGIHSSPSLASFRSASHGKADPGLSVLNEQQLSQQITAHAAHQQQAEMTNLVTGQLDYDGIDPELVIHLLSLHWNRQHHAFLVTYRPLFMRDMAASGGGRYFSKLLLHAILFGSAKFSNRTAQLRARHDDPSTAGYVFLRRIEELLPEALKTSRMTTVQALLLLACTHFARGAESAAWLHSGLAFRMAADLGLFAYDAKDEAAQLARGQFACEELELRRRLAWAAYVIDKIHSLYHGRQVSIKAVDIRTPAVFLDKFEECEYWTPIAYQKSDESAKARAFGCPVYSVSTFTQLCRLTTDMERIIETFYSMNSKSVPKNEMLENLREVENSLQQWYHALPAHLDVSHMGSDDVKSPNVVSLHALYHCLVILLHRPFLPYGHLYDIEGDTSAGAESSAASTARWAWKECVDSAMQISTLMSFYRRSITMKAAPQLISYINFCAAGIHVRLAAQVNRHQAQDAHGKATAQATLIAAQNAIQACLQDFEENERPNPGVAKANLVLRRMAKHFNVNLSLKHSGSKESMGGKTASSDDKQAAGLSVLSALASDEASRSTVPCSVEQFAPSNPHLPLDEGPTSDVIDLDVLLASFSDRGTIDGLANFFDGFDSVTWESNDGYSSNVTDEMFGFLKDTTASGFEGATM